MAGVEDEGTTIRVKQGTKQILDSFKIISRESYDSVIARIVQDFVEEQLEINEQTKKLIDNRMRNLGEGKVLSLGELLKRVQEKKRLS